MSKVEEIFNIMVEDFKANNNKPNLIKILKDFCINETTTPNEIYELKTKLELDFSKKVNCTYCYNLKTPVSYGCDLREIFYDRQNNLIEGGQEVLSLFNEKKLPDIWHIMTDIDDTLYPNTEHKTYIAGSDISWSQKEPYPGIIKFYRNFYEKLPKLSRYTTILSATPGCLKKSKLTDKNGLLHTILNNYGFIQGPHEGKLQIASALGSAISNYPSHIFGTNKYTSVNNLNSLFTFFGNTKFERFKQYLSLFPEYKIIFIGDNGQGDVLAGTQMIKYSPNCYVFIHKVSEDGVTFKTIPEENMNEPRLGFFKNYYELSKKFKEIGLFNDNDILFVKNAINTHLTLRKNVSFKNLYNLSGGKKNKKTIKKSRKTKKITQKNKKRIYKK